MMKILIGWLEGAIGPWLLGGLGLLLSGLLGWALWMRAEAAQLGPTRNKLTETKHTLQQERQQHAQALKMLQADLQAERDKTASWLEVRDRIDQMAEKLGREISNVQFHAPPLAPVNGACPGDPVGSPEFLRFYNAAAGGNPADSPSAGGMPARQP